MFSGGRVIVVLEMTVFCCSVCCELSLFWFIKLFCDGPPAACSLISCGCLALEIVINKTIIKTNRPNSILSDFLLVIFIYFFLSTYREFFMLHGFYLHTV